MTADTKLWNNKLEALSKIDSFPTKITNLNLFTKPVLEKLIKILSSLILDSHYKV